MEKVAAMWLSTILSTHGLQSFEAKYTKNLEKLESECDTALRQIDDRMYAKEYEDDYDQVLCYGISFLRSGVW